MREERVLMVRGLKARGLIVTPEVERAMLQVPRHIFLPPDVRRIAYRDTPLPLGEGQTISAPHMVAVMAEAMQLLPGHKVLEIGAGSGYNAAVMAEIIGKKGQVITVERHPCLAEKAGQVLSENGYDNVKVVVGDGSLGYEAEAPYDRISVTCGAPEVPEPLTEQLKEGGIMVIPVGQLDVQSLIRAKKVNGRLVKENLGSVVFVPLLGEKGHRSD